MADLEQTFDVLLFEKHKHKDEDAAVYQVKTTLPKLSMIVESWRETSASCCWEAYSEADVCVAYRGCR